MKYSLLAFGILGTVFTLASCMPSLPELPDIPEIPEVPELPDVPALETPALDSFTPAPEGVLPSAPALSGVNVGDPGFKPMCVAGWVETSPGVSVVSTWDSFTGIREITDVTTDLKLDLDVC